MRKLLLLCLLSMLLLPVVSCTEEAEEAVDLKTDVIVRNYSDDDLWIKVDGVAKGEVENDGIAITVAESLVDGYHTITAYRDPEYKVFDCQVLTDWLDDGEDFYLYFQDNDTYTGTVEGNCR